MPTPDEGRGFPVSAIRAGLGCRCPRCGKGKLYTGYLTVASKCRVCDLTLDKLGSGDGPAVIIVLIVGIIVMGAALVSEIFIAAPFWLHLIVWIPFILILSLGLLRPVKATLIAFQLSHVDGDVMRKYE